MLSLISSRILATPVQDIVHFVLDFRMFLGERPGKLLLQPLDFLVLVVHEVHEAATLGFCAEQLLEII